MTTHSHYVSYRLNSIRPAATRNQVKVISTRLVGQRFLLHTGLPCIFLSGLVSIPLQQIVHSACTSCSLEAWEKEVQEIKLKTEPKSTKSLTALHFRI